MASSQVIKHFKTRLDSIKAEKISKLPPRGLTPDEQLEHLLSGKFEAEATKYGVTITYPSNKDRAEAYEKAYNEICSEYNKVLDQLYLSEEPDLLSMLEGFRNFKV